MTDDKAKELIAAVRELTAVIQSLNQKQPPNLFRPLEDFPRFDWENELPGCRIIARDKFGPTEVDYDGHIYRRYRSSEDDSKGIDIRYRCVLNGTVADKNLKWGSLIKFGEPKKTKPLNTAVQEKIAERAAANPQPPIVKPAPPAPAATIAVPVAPPRPPDPGDLTPAQDNMFIRWTKAAEVWRKTKGEHIPFQYALEHGLTDEEIRMRVEALEKAINYSHDELMAQYEARRAEAVAKLKALIAQADAAGCEIPATYRSGWNQTAELIEMTIGTVQNLIKIHQSRNPGGRPAQSDKSVDLNLERGVINSKQETAFKNKFRIGPNDRNHVFLALNQVAGGDAGRHAVIAWATDGQTESQKELSDAWVYALFNWLKPHKNGDGKWHVTPIAEKAIAQILKESAPATSN